MTALIDQALQQGIVAHREGKLLEAENLYRAILENDPKHPHANHNLGLLAVGLGQEEGALTFLKRAVEVNPKESTFWVSYIDVLIKTSRSTAAKKALEQAAKNGINDTRLNAIEFELLFLDEGASQNKKLLKSI